MPECWLKINRRTLLAELVLPILLFSAATGLASRGRHPLLSILAAILAAAGVAVTLHILMRSRIPRLGYADGMLLVYLCGSRPIRVPIDIVECFFRGQAPALVRSKSLPDTEAATIVVRLAESASQWHQREVHRMLGQWCDGYIIIRGTWCEPIDARLLERLNRRLLEVHRQQRQEATRGA